MRLIFFSMSFVCLLLLSCNDSEEDSLLGQAPYERLSDSIRKDPANADLHYHRGKLLYSNNEAAYAESDIREAWQLQHKEEFALSLTTILKQKNPDSAILFLQQAIRELPQSVALRIGLARGFQQKKNSDEAMRICDSIITRYPGQLDALVLKSELLKDQNRNAEALATLENAHNYAPNDVELTHDLAFEYAQEKNPKALALADSLILSDKEQRHAEPYYFKGLYYENLGNEKQALHFFDEAIRHDYYFLDAYMDKGQTLYESKNYAAALKTFELASTITPTYAEAYLWIGKTQEAMGKKDDARLNYQRAYGLDKTLKEAKDAAERLK
ncbi:MAG: tetratricopeptide repeat protein [Flavisolibacter sp.]